VRFRVVEFASKYTEHLMRCIEVSSDHLLNLRSAKHKHL
jgi:hypothetical protein